MEHWQFHSLNPNDNSGISTVDDNFANEERSNVEILVRETLQNPLDAKDSNQLVEVRYSLVTVKRSGSGFLKALFSDECLLHFSAGRLLKTGELPETLDFLVIEDFGTSGLEGCYTDSSVDGRAENWNAFWFREGEGAKPTKSNGGAGQGKITLFAASSIRSVLALTKRKSDGKKLLFGCCRFKQNYKIEGRSARWAKEARWGRVSNPNELALPIEDEALIQAVQDELGLQRHDRPGTSFLVPLPVGITLPEIKKAVIDEFFFPIRRGKLKVSIDNLVLDSSTISKSAKELGPAARYHGDYRNFLEDSISEHIDTEPLATAKMGWEKSSKLGESSFMMDELVALKKNFEESKIISVDFPVKVRRKGKASIVNMFRVVLRQYLDGEQSHELFIRQDLGIDGEKRLKGSRRIQPVLALTFIDEVELSSFLTAAEEPTHRTWNSRRPKVVSLYDGTGDLLSLVRNAALRLVELLTPAGKRDNTALALYFADPESVKVHQKGARGNNENQNNGEGKEVPVISGARKKPVEIQPRKDGFSIRAIPSEIKKRCLPLVCEVHTAYATTYGNAFSQWDAAEFWLNNEKDFPIHSEGVSNIQRDGNIVRFEINSLDANISISGFDLNRKVEVQIDYRESKNAEDFANNEPN